LISIMEDDEGLVFDRLQLDGDFPGQSVDLLAIVPGVLFILRGMFRVACAQRLRNIRCQDLSVLRVEPEMQVIFAMAVVMIMPGFGSFRGMIVLLVIMGVVVTFMPVVMRFKRTAFTEL